MTPQEQQMLQGLIDRISHTQLPEKDADAESLLQSTLGRNPDALYILAQTVLVQQYALTQAQKQLADLRTETDQLRQQAAAPQKHTSFLGSLLGRDDDTPRQPPPPPPPAQSQQPGYSPVPGYPGAAPAYGSPSGQPGYAQPGYGQPAPGGQPGGGFLRSAMQTATGVAAGALAFQGIESLMHGFGHSAGYGGGFGSPGFGGGFGDSGPREEVINNYYGDQSAGTSTSGTSTDSGQSSAFIPNLDSSSGNDIWSSPSGDTSSSSADSSQFADTADTSTQDDSSTFDDASNTGLDDNSSGGFDDSGNGGFDDNSGGFDDGGGGFDDGGDNS